ncbi:hypothetical protein D0T84_05615 [Dysgonomonas sp. 521]|uniref:hypothetical protein n=1 Tax=Dysgonomonas sp. 521 TaxID=2302932 RepID=UPI0013D3BE43|nr:hypothetical protein [Dysgonomonas sp. 521]NDV94397.1 hypothetical protein [Dysgonomonas sp. 521]
MTRNNLYALLILTLIISCGSKNNERKTGAGTIAETVLNEPEPQTDIILDTIVLPYVYNNEGVEIFLPGLYRNDEPSDFAHMLREEWYELYQDSVSKNYYFVEADLDINKYDDDCMGLGYQSTYVSSKRDRDDSKLFGQAILFIKGINAGDSLVNSVHLKQRMVWVGNRMPFGLSGKQYALEATGHVTEDSSIHRNEEGLLVKWEDVLNYKLYLVSEQDGKEKRELLVAIPSFNDKNVEILFIGDLDHDDKPDFVFSTARHYESANVVLMLSSKAKDGESVRCVGESGYSFDC